MFLVCRPFLPVLSLSPASDALKLFLNIIDFSWFTDLCLVTEKRTGKERIVRKEVGRKKQYLIHRLQS